MLFPGMDVEALAIMTFLLVSHSGRSVPEDAAAAILDESCYSFMFTGPDYKGALPRAVVAPAVNQNNKCWPLVGGLLLRPAGSTLIG